MESNVQKMREAARHLLCVIEEMGFKPWCADDPLAIACEKLDAALAEPLLNCNVGTAQEQAIRFDEFCQECEKCPLNEKRLNIKLVQCEFLWGQIPYEEGDAE